MAYGDVNWLAVLVATIINMFVGFLWYGPLFGKQWMNMTDKSMDEMDPDPTMYVYTGLAALVSSYVLALLIGASGASGLAAGAVVGLVVWLGIGATGTLVYTIFQGPPKSVWMLHGLYQLVVFAINGALLASWV
ncbi:MAG: DUF1761 domain-containing protein [Anaerolineales bacterium]